MRELVKLTVFTLCARGIAYLRPRQSYEKYFQLLMSMLILLLFLKPVAGFFGASLTVDFESFQSQFEEQLDVGSITEEAHYGTPREEEEGVEMEGIREIEIPFVTMGGEDEP